MPLSAAPYNEYFAVRKYHPCKIINVVIHFAFTILRRSSLLVGSMKPENRVAFHAIKSKLVFDAVFYDFVKGKF